MKLRIPSIARLSFPLASALALMLGSTAQAVDYSYGSSTGAFSITATDQARALGTNLAIFNNNTGDMGIYWRNPTATDATYMHFDLSSLAGGTIVGTVSLNQTVNALYGGQITDGKISTANATWTGTGATPGFTAIGDSALVNGTFTTGSIATWTLSETTFQGFVNTPATFYGLVLSAANPSQAHFYGTPTLTGTATTAQIVVSNATDWSAAIFNAGTTTLTVSGSDNVSGGNVAVKAGATLSVVGAATLDSGSFAGTFANNGTLSLGSTAAQTLNGAVSGSGTLVKDGSGTLTLTAQNSFTGPININGGILEFSADLSSSSPYQSTQIHINNGSTLRIPGASSNMPIFDGKHYTFDASGGGSILLGQGNYHAWSTSFSFTTNGGARNNVGLITTSSPYGLNLGNATATFNVALGTDATSDLAVTPIIVNTGSIVKNGAGRLTLAAQNTYTGFTSLNEGTLRITTSTGLGAGGFDGGTMTQIANNAALELEGDLTITEHFHMQGAGPAGQGVLRSLSGNSSLTTNFALRGDSTFAVDSGSLTISATIYEHLGSYGLTKAGAGTLVFSGSNSYTGATTVSLGTLALVGGSQASPVTVSSGASLEFTLGSPTTSTSSFDLTAGTVKITGTPSLPSYTLISSSTGITGTPTLDAPIAGYALMVDGTSLKLVQTGGYASWMAPFITGGLTGDTTPGGDPENDGMTNLLEYALNGNPSISDPSIQPDLVVTATDFEFTYSRLDLSLADTTQTFEYGSDLTGWTPVIIPAGPGVSTVGAATVTITDTGATDSVKISIPKSVSPSGKLFGRLQVVK